jgi:membrane protein CcdC involved in cytochrome C biogenesis
MHTTDLPYSFRQIVITAAVIFVLVAYKLSQVALETGNFEGMWFSLAHTAIVIVGVILALRTP